MEEAIGAGRVTVNDRRAKPGMRARAEAKIIFDGKLLPPPSRRRRLLLYNKPRGEVVSVRDDSRPTVFARLPKITAGKWINIGRLDIDSEGLLLFANDGDLANRLAHPRYQWRREYRARAAGVLTQNDLAKIRAGIDIGGGVIVPEMFELSQSAGGANKWYRVMLREGRNRIVRRIFARFGLQVSRLLRVAYGPFTLPADLAAGQWREVSARQIEEVDGKIKA
jgi:23S rRNA pseudouridine2605 synthase